MKLSYYNIFFPLDETYILYNTLKGSIFVIDSQVKDLLENNNISSLDEEYIQTFTENGILVEDELNEQTVYRLMVERSKYMTPLTAVQVATTYNCNLACIYCYEGKGELEKKSMDEKTAHCAIKFIKDLVINDGSTALRVELFGGEPLLNMPVSLLLADKLSRWCEDIGKGFKINPLTNGTLSTPEVVEAFAQYNCKFLVNIDGPREIHDTRRIHKNGTGTFDEIIEGLHRVRDYGMGIQIRMNVDETNREYIVPFFEFLKDEGFVDVNLTIKPVFNTSPACSSYGYCIPDAQGLTVANHFYSIARSMGITTGEPEKPSPQGVCAAQKFSNFIIDPYLRLFKCNILLPFEKNAVGVINPETAEPVFNHVNVDFMSRDPLAIEECSTCKLVPVCRGGCNAEIFETQGTTHGYICRKSGIYDVLQENLTAFVRKTMQ
jgi:uncharacterized protein